MKRSLLLLCVTWLTQIYSYGQSGRADIYSEFVFYQRRVAMENDLRQRVIGKTFNMPLDSNTEYKYESACSAISQFMFANKDVENGFQKMFLKYDSLEYATKKAFLEAVYAVYPNQYASSVEEVLMKEADPKLFSICAVYLFRNDSSTDHANSLKIAIVEKFPEYDSLPVLAELIKYLSYRNSWVRTKTPDIVELFRNQRMTGHKIIYSFQRWNRDYPGLAIVQNANGRFVRDGSGRLLVFEQLARSGSNLPYFLNGGSTPQGIYSIQGTGVAHNNFIGPTPNIQMLMPFENKWEKYFRQGWEPGQDSLQLYRQLLPPSWRKYEPLMESWNAGKLGRNEIIAHGTALDPEYFKDKPYYPLTPTSGCLCAKELWNTTSGRLLISEQFNLVSAFQSTANSKGYLFVINIDNQQRAVSRQELEMLVNKFERSK